MAAAGQAELAFVVDVSLLTEEGFKGTTKYAGKEVEISFDDKGEGVFLTSEMASRLHVRKGSRLSIVVEGDKNQVAEAAAATVGRGIRISDPKVYYAVGREGGAVVRIRKG